MSIFKSSHESAYPSLYELLSGHVAAVWSSFVATVEDWYICGDLRDDLCGWPSNPHTRGVTAYTNLL